MRSVVTADSGVTSVHRVALRRLLFLAFLALPGAGISQAASFNEMGHLSCVTRAAEAVEVHILLVDGRRHVLMVRPTWWVMFPIAEGGPGLPEPDDGGQIPWVGFADDGPAVAAAETGGSS